MLRTRISFQHARRRPSPRRRAPRPTGPARASPRCRPAWRHERACPDGDTAVRSVRRSPDGRSPRRIPRPRPLVGDRGALGVLLLAEQGADVIKVEPPGGDPFRDYSGYAVWNRSRRSVTVDLKQPDGRRRVPPARRRRRRARRDVPARASPTGSASGSTRCTPRNPRLVYASCPAYPDGHRLAQRPGYDALVQASSGQQWEQPGWRLGPIFLHVPMPSMAAMFLVPTGILAALVAREETGRGQHVRTSLFQGALLFTTQIWTYVEHSRADFFGTMVKSYPPGVHQEMIFEVAERRVGAHVDHERAHADQEPGRDRRRRRARPIRRAIRCSRRRSARRSRRCAAPAYKARERDELIDEFRENNHAIEAIDTMEAALGARRRAAPAARRERHGRDGRRSRARHDDPGRRADPPRTARRARSRARGPRPGSTTTRSSASSATRPTRSRRSPGRRCS